MARYRFHGATHITNPDGSIKSIHPMSFNWEVDSLKKACELLDRTLINVDRNYHGLVQFPEWIKCKSFTVYQAQETKDFYICAK